MGSPKGAPENVKHGDTTDTEITGIATLWAPAALQGPILAKAPVRFRAPWQWNGGPAVLQSRATDDTGMVQPIRRAFASAERGLRGVYHYNAIASWCIDEKGEATNVYA
jgi:sulfane dehydrogenase subunit SoxC